MFTLHIVEHNFISSFVENFKPLFPRSGKSSL